MTTVIKTVRGLARRHFRANLRSEIGKNKINRFPGFAQLAGYGFGMAFPDHLVWANQILQIFGDDCYGVHQLPDVCTVVDAGANIGTFSAYVKWVRPAAKVIAIEPSPANLKYLRNNLARYSPQEVEIIPTALGAAVGSLRLAGTVSDSFRTGDVGSEVVDVRTLHDILDWRTIDLLKMDIEGAEVNVLRSAIEDMKQVQRVVIEYHRYRHHSDSMGEMIAALEKAGFDRFRIYAETAFDWQDDALPVYCCHVEAKRA